MATEPILDLSRGLIQYGGKPCVVYLFGADKQEWFDCRCIAEILEITHLPTAMQRVDVSSKSHLDDLIGRLGQPEALSRLCGLNTHNPGGVSHHDLRSWVVDEAGLYELAFGSRKAEAVVFRRWVCREVLPQIRKTGTFSLKRKAEATEDPVRQEDGGGAAGSAGIATFHDCHGAVAEVRGRWRQGLGFGRAEKRRDKKRQAHR